MKISIIIVSFNTQKLTLDCIESIKQERSEIDKEVIVIDNNSKDGSVKSLKRLANQKEIILIENKVNTGFAKANNQGIKIAKGEHILLLNSDTLVTKSILDKLVDFADRNTDAGLVATKLLNIDGTDQPSCLYFPSLANAVREYWLGKSGLFEKYVPKSKKPVAVECAVAASLLITKRALEKVGLLDERYFFYFEDIDYCRRVKRAGLKTYYLPEIKVFHVHGASGKSLAADKDQWKRLIPSSKIYHGLLKHYLLTAVIWIGQKWLKIIIKS